MIEVGEISKDTAGNFLVDSDGFVSCKSKGITIIIYILIIIYIN